MTLPRYSEYLESSLQWVGSAPKHWVMCKLGYCFDAPPCYGVLVPDFEFGGVPMIRITDMQRGKVKLGDLTTISPALSAEYSRTIVRRGDVLLSVVGTIGEVVHVDEGLEGVNLSRAVARIQVDRTRLEPKFLGWLLQSTVFSTYVDLVCVGSAQRVLNMGDLCAFVTALPSIREQAAIASFLDRETAKIDALIAEQEKLIALLAEKRQTTISRAVTRGLDPSVLLKDSCVPWLGKVPAHWDITRLKFVANVQTGIAKGKDVANKETITVPYLRVANVQDGYLALEEIAMIEIEPAQLARYRLQVGDVLMNEGGDFDKLGRGAIWQGEIPDCIHQNHVFAVRPHSISSDWLNQLTSSDYAQFYFMTRSKQSTNLASISSSNIMEMPVLMPPESEQETILTFITMANQKADQLMWNAESAISLLKERRAALISAAVTGKIDVRGLAA